jgi:hypothetical protein
MRRKNLSGLLLIAITLFFMGCDKEIETSSMSVDLTKNATVKAFVYADLNQTSLGNEFAPNGTKVFVTVAYNQLGGTGSNKWIDSTFVNNGMIELSVPATINGVTVEFAPTEFIFDQTQPFGSVSQTQKKLFKASVSSLNGVKAGEVRTHEITYTGSAFQNVTEFVTRKFEMSALLNVKNAADVLPSGTIVTFFTNDWSATATVGGNGRVEINLPKNKSGIYARFTAQKQVAIGDNPNKMENYRYTTSLSSYSESSPVVENIYFGGGEKWE